MCYQKYSVARYCSHFRSIRRFHLQADRQLVAHPWTLGEWDEGYISGFSERIDYRGISYRTSSSSSRNYCMQWVFDQQIWVLCPAAVDPLRYSGCGRVRCNGAGEGLCKDGQLFLQQVTALIYVRAADDIPARETHMTCEALERFDVGICST